MVMNPTELAPRRVKQLSFEGLEVGDSRAALQASVVLMEEGLHLGADVEFMVHARVTEVRFVSPNGNGSGPIRLHVCRPVSATVVK